MGAVARRETARRRSVRAGLVGAVVAVGIVMFAVTAQNGLPDYLPGVSRTDVKAQFTDVGALREGDDVRIADLRAGFVSSITLVEGHPVVDMRLDHGRPVYQDATVSIGSRSGLGQKYIELDPGTPSAGRLDAGATIPVSRTQTTVELDEALSALDAKTRQGLQTTLRQTGGGVAGRGDDLSDAISALPHVLPDVQKVADALSADQGADTEQLLRAADVLATSLDQQSGDIATMTRDLATTFDALAADDGKPLGDALQQAPAAMTRLRATLASLDQPLRTTSEAARRLRPGAKALGDATPSVRGLLRDSVPTLRQVPGVADDAERAVTDLTPLLDHARPVVEQLGDALTRGQSPLATLAPYAREVLLFFTNAQSALSQGDGAGRWLRFYVVPTPESVLSTVSVPTPLTHRDPYPAPGAAARHRTSSAGDKLIGMVP